MAEILFSGEQLYKLIPQRPPIVMVDKLFSASDTEAETGLLITEDNIFVSKAGMGEDKTASRLREPGLIEHIAQSAATFAGYSTFSKGLPPRLGYIGEIKKCKIHQLPKVGDELVTEIHLVAEAAGVSLVDAKTLHSDTVVAECQMKIFLKE